MSSKNGRFHGTSHVHSSHTLSRLDDLNLGRFPSFPLLISLASSSGFVQLVSRVPRFLFVSFARRALALSLRLAVVCFVSSSPTLFSCPIPILGCFSFFLRGRLPSFNCTSIPTIPLLAKAFALKYLRSILRVIVFDFFPL